MYQNQAEMSRERTDKKKDFFGNQSGIRKKLPLPKIAYFFNFNGLSKIPDLPSKLIFAGISGQFVIFILHSGYYGEQAQHYRERSSIQPIRLRHRRARMV